MAEKRSAWAVGWTYFAMCMMFMLSMWWIIVGLIAVAANEFLVATPRYIFQFDVTTWGWIHFAVGLLTLFAAMALFVGAVWARTIGVIIAILGGLAAFAWLPYNTAFAVLLIAASIAVIWALTAHGRDIATAS